MKILAFSHTGLVTGGAEQCLLEYVDILSSRGHACRVVMPHGGAMQEVLKKKGISHAVIGYGWAIRPHKKFNAHELRASHGNSLAKIFHEVEKYKPDVILVNTAVIPWGLYAGRVLGVPTVLLVHEILNDKDPSLHVLPNYKVYSAILNANTDTVVFNSKFVQSEFKDDLTRPITSKKILYPLPPLDIEQIKSAYKENRIGSTLKIAIFGALAPRKNQLEAVEAAKILRDKGVDNFVIDFYGDKAANLPYVRELRTQIKKYSLESNVRLKGFTHSAYETMNKYNILLSTSTYEPFGRAVVEGQLFGRIAIVNDTGGGPELVTDGVTGLIYKLGNPEELADKIALVQRNPEECIAMAEAARAIQAETFLKQTRYDALIESVEYYDHNQASIKELAENDLFNPIRSLYEYNHRLNVRYSKFERIINNRITRTIKGIAIRSKSRLKRLVKELLVN